jgi:hypothetical protein
MTGGFMTLDATSTSADIDVFFAELRLRRQSLSYIGDGRFAGTTGPAPQPQPTPPVVVPPQQRGLIIADKDGAHIFTMAASGAITAAWSRLRQLRDQFVAWAFEPGGQDVATLSAALVAAFDAGFMASKGGEA